jgi:hypothetical protein
MQSQPATLSPADLQAFERDGYVVVRQAFAPADALAMQGRWWSELAETRGIQRDDPATWRQPQGNLKAAKRDPAQAAILSGTVRGVLDDLLGAGTWPPPRDWGVTLATFPAPGSWELPTRFWHWDNPCAPHLDRPGGCSWSASSAPSGRGAAERCSYVLSRSISVGVAGHFRGWMDLLSPGLLGADKTGRGRSEGG